MARRRTPHKGKTCPKCLRRSALNHHHWGSTTGETCRHCGYQKWEVAETDPMEYLDPDGPLNQDFDQNDEFVEMEQ